MQSRSIVPVGIRSRSNKERRNNLQWYAAVYLYHTIACAIHLRYNPGAMEHILRLHANLLFTILLVFSVLALWALILGLLRRPVGAWLHSGMAIGVLLVLSECVLGVILLMRGLLPLRPEMHILYGIIALLTIPIAHSSARNREPRSQGLMYAFACMFVCIIALRAVEMARP
ncbi:hypothetical protein [Roseiflexus sp.]